MLFIGNGVEEPILNSFALNTITGLQIFSESQVIQYKINMKSCLRKEIFYLKVMANIKMLILVKQSVSLYFMRYVRGEPFASKACRIRSSSLAPVL